ncbi:glycosyltransferase family 61 protein [Methylobacterium sp. J-090]|uniref:glycosyltransferase family 61 protein n=1 Tax=Methylobacterium sp. J-090 TaxID=2836666 RepID=UPI001FB8AE04|nr:glycosyltransferase family 61 protein [Methylobacterium sp. J-090]MCJ2083687.1 glycosyltransferase family 61 protein [Methylobacterium sp. J-090]
MTDLLERCRVVWGRTDRIAAPPALRVVTDAVYRPAIGTAPRTPAAPDGTHSDGTHLDGNSPDVAGEGPVARAEAIPHLYLGPLATHYGHFLVGTLGRLWPLLDWHGPPPRLLYQGDADPTALPFLAPILAGFGLTPDDVVRFDRPTRIPYLVLPEPSLVEQAFAHAVHADLVRTIGRPFWSGVAVDGVARPAYLSKTRLASGISRLRNEPDLEAALARRGVDIVYPETLELPDLVRLFSERRVVMGTTGSAFHTAAFAAPGRRILGLNWAPHLNANFPLLDGLNGTRGRYYHPAGSQSGPDEGFHFGWSVPDPEGVAAELVRRAADFDGLEALDVERDIARRRAGRGPLTARIGRWLGRP